jgi:predicted DNA-binding transcriptional regulator AlpA
MSKQDNQCERLINERQVADLVGVSVATVRRWRLRKWGPRYVKIGALVRYCPRAVRGWLNAQPTGGDPEFEGPPGSVGESPNNGYAEKLDQL